MKKLFIPLIAFALLGGVAKGNQVTVARVEGMIGPASAKFMVGVIDRAERDGSACIVFELDTPGGLDEAMRQIIKRIMSSKVPVAVYVAPSGSRAASAGAFITIAAHVAAMAPGTNIGAAHPVSIGQSGQIDSTMSGKVTNDAAAYIRSIAKIRGRNISWADSAVRKSVSLSETEALASKVIDLVAPSTVALLDSIDGRPVKLDDRTDTLRTKGAAIREVSMTWRDRFLHTLSNPNLAYIFFMIGLLGLYFEFSNPGAILPGVMGAIGLILAFFAFQTLSVSIAGILLILLAIILFIVDVKAATHGILTTGGIVAMFVGSVMLFNSPDPAMHASLQVILPVVLVTAAFFVIGVWLSIKSHGKKPVTGASGLLGLEGDARTKVTRDGGRVFVAGAHWSAVSEGDIPEGAKIKVVGTKGMTLKVEQL
ncbi:MAG: nodulation protein NfeD [Candidatus Edwardsbacteria bacterium]|nr:nodulation protein NfeD [Candidatus Edwardsbacteria bacterium]